LPEPEESETPVVLIYLKSLLLTVEWVDTTAKDADFKAYKTTVAVPKHWAQQRKFKLGTDKMPWTSLAFPSCERRGSC